MAHFYGQVQGSRGAATRLGGAAGGMHTLAASYEGAVHVRLYHADGRDFAHVYVRQWGSRPTQERELYDGPIQSNEATNAAPRQDGTIGRRHISARKQYDRISARARAEAFKVVEAEAQRILPRGWTLYIMVGWGVSVHDANGDTVEPHTMKKRMQDLCFLAADLSDTFGAGNEHITGLGDGAALTGGRDAE